MKTPKHILHEWQPGQNRYTLCGIRVKDIRIYNCYWPREYFTNRKKWRGGLCHACATSPVVPVYELRYATL